MLDFLEDNLKKVQEKIGETCAKYSVNRGDITLCAVSKTKPFEYIKKIESCGINTFGENYVQEIIAKVPQEGRSFSLHLIGHLQSNKVSKVIKFVDSIDSIDSFSLLQKVNKAAAASGKKIDIMFEYNTSGDATKSGFRDKDDFFKSLDALSTLENVNFTGLMTMGPLGGSEKEIRLSFEKFNAIYDESKSRYKNLDFRFKSFGMSGDYKIAIEMGSNFLRIGTAIFGTR